MLWKWFGCCLCIGGTLNTWLFPYKLRILHANAQKLATF